MRVVADPGNAECRPQKISLFVMDDLSAGGRGHRAFQTVLMILQPMRRAPYKMSTAVKRTRVCPVRNMKTGTGLQSGPGTQITNSPIVCLNVRVVCCPRKSFFAMHGMCER